MKNNPKDIAKRLITLEVRLALLVDAIKDHPDFDHIEADAESDFDTFVKEVRSASEDASSVDTAGSDTLDPAFIIPELLFNPVTMAAASKDEDG